MARIMTGQSLLKTFGQSDIEALRMLNASQDVNVMEIHKLLVVACRGVARWPDFEHGPPSLQALRRGKPAEFLRTLSGLLAGLPGRSPLRAGEGWCIRQDLNLQPSDPKSEALSN
jgi:hypothetical protein